MYVGSIVHPNQGVPILIEALPRVFEAVPRRAAFWSAGPPKPVSAYRPSSASMAIA